MYSPLNLFGYWTLNKHYYYYYYAFTPTKHRAKHIYISHSSPTPPTHHTHLYYVICNKHNTSTMCVTHILTPTTSPLAPTPAFPSPSNYLSIVTAHTNNNTRITVTASTTQGTKRSSQTDQEQPHRVPKEPHRQTKNNHMPTHTTQAHRPSSKCERNLIILQVTEMIFGEGCVQE